MNRYNFPTDNAIDFLFSKLHTTPFHYDVLKIGSRQRYPLGKYSDSNAMHFYNILTVGQFSRKLSQLEFKNQTKDMHVRSVLLSTSNWFHTKEQFTYALRNDCLH